MKRRAGETPARLMRRFGVSNTVLLIICLMYLILYVDLPITGDDHVLSPRGRNAAASGKIRTSPW